MASVKKNFIYILMYNILTMILPLVTSPLLSRRLGANALGIYTYVDAVVSIFLVFANTGIYKYGMREIAKTASDKEKLNQKYTDFWFTNGVNVFIVLIIYLLFTGFIAGDEYKIYFHIRTGAILAVMFDNAFLFCGMENIRPITIRDASIKLSAFFLIVVLIKSTDDLTLYFMIMTLGTLLPAIIGFIYGKRYVTLKKPNILNCIRLYKPLLLMMVPTLASTIYQSMDKVMIGFLYNHENVGYYECACKTLIVRTVITSLGTAMCPHLTGLYVKGEYEEGNRKFKNTFMLCLVLSYCLMFGIIAVAKDFAPFFWGNNFSVCSELMSGLAICIPLWCIGEVIRTQYLLTHSRDNEYMISFVTGVIVNAVINTLLIPKFGAMGAVTATIIAELTMSVMQIAFVKHDIPVKQYVLGTFPYFIISFIMFMVIKLMSKKLNCIVPVKLIIEILAGIFICILLIVIYEKKTKTDLILSNFYKMKLKK